MQDAFEWLIREYGHLMGLKVWAELLGGTFQGQGCLLQLGVSDFQVDQRFAHIVDGPLFFVFLMTKQNNTNYIVWHD